MDPLGSGEPLVDVVALGAGPGGYVAAIRASQLGLQTALVERDQLGGVCLNLGCVPSKTMLRGVELLHLTGGAAAFGLTSDHPSMSYSELVAHRNATVAKLRQGVTSLLKANDIRVITGTARVTGPHALEVETEGGPWSVAFRHLIVATGSHSAAPPISGVDLPGVVDSDAALDLPAPPQRAIIIGGGAVGLEWADIWRGFGSEVTVLELMPQILPSLDPEVARELAHAFTRKGIVVRTAIQVESITRKANGLEVSARATDGPEIFLADVVLIATGRQPNTDNLGLAAAGVRFGRSGVPTDGHMRTNVPHIFAVGDVTGRHLLAHVASHQGIIAAETIAGRERIFDERAVPSVVFTDPEVANVGLGERDATERGLKVRVGRYPFAASSRALASGETTGFVKLIAHRDSGELLGAQIVGPRAGDLISEVGLAIQLRASLRDLGDTIHPHPTFGEAIMEAAWVALGHPIHIPPRPARPTRSE